MIKIVFKNGTIENIDTNNIFYILNNREYRLIKSIGDYNVETELNEKNLIKLQHQRDKKYIKMFYNNGSSVDLLPSMEYNYKSLIKNHTFI